VSKKPNIFAYDRRVVFLGNWLQIEPVIWQFDALNESVYCSYSECPKWHTSLCLL